MQPRLIKAGQATYIQAEWTGTNESGRVPLGKTVIVKCDECNAQSMGGILLTEDMVERMTLAAESGIIVAIGADAYKRHDDGALWVEGKPVPGDRVEFMKYAGVVITGADGKHYRVMGVENVVSMLDKSVVMSGEASEAALRTF